MTLMCIERSQSPTHKNNFLQSRKSPVNNNNNNNNINQQNANHHRQNSCSPPLTKIQPQDSSNAIKSLNLDSSKKLERSTSETDRRTVQSNSSRYKTELCRPFEENGTCKYGDKCQFAHGIKELRSMARHPKYKTELCRTFHSTGLCPYGPRCHFIHNSEQSKKSLLTNFTGNVPPNPVSRPKALTSLGSAGDISPPSSHGGTPTGMKTFDDLYQQQTTPLSPTTVNNAFSFPQDYTNIVNSFNQRFIEIPGRDFSTDLYDSVNVFNEGILSSLDNNIDNYNYQGGPVLDLFQTASLSPPAPGDVNVSCFNLPVFDLFHNNKQQQVI